MFALKETSADRSAPTMLVEDLDLYAEVCVKALLQRSRTHGVSDKTDTSIRLADIQ